MAKRQRLEIIHDILRIIKMNGSIRFTPLLRKSNISTSRFREYFSELEKKGFIRKINKKDGKFIQITEKGMKFLEKYKTIVNFIDEFGL